jgi:hypothetical protein
MKIKMTKRLTAIIIACTLTLAVGTAFAFSPGALDIGANINLATPTYVVWSDVFLSTYNPDVISPNPGPPMPMYFPLFGHQRAEIVDSRGRADQAIEWDLFLYGCDDMGEFIAWGSIMAQATNNSERFPMLITALNPVVELEGDFYDPAVFGLSLVFESDSLDDFLGVLQPGETTPDLWITIEWDGTWPEGWEYYDIDGYALAATLTLTFTYEIYAD